MTDRLYKNGASRGQSFLLPPSVEDYVSPNNPVRAIDVYVDGLDFRKLGFTHTQGGLSKGQPSYDPADMLSLYLYGYLNRIRSSRNLERETHRNLEVIWLIRGLRPTYKTIADFRKNNLKAIKAVNRDFVLFCRNFKLIDAQLVGIDGSFFNGNASKGSIKTKGKLKKEIKRLDVNIAEYLEEMDSSDNADEAQPFEDADLKEKLAKLKKRRKSCQDKLDGMEKSGQTQLSSTDPDARLLSKEGRRTAGYNAQYAVDDKHKLLVTCDVVNDGNDLNQLLPMARKAKEALGVEKLEVAADGGYFNQAQIIDCHEAGITAYVAVPKSRTARKGGRYALKDFRFDKDRNAYQCPRGEDLNQHSSLVRGGRLLITYASKKSICRQCSVKEKCLTEKTPYRSISRYENGEVIEALEKRMAEKGGEYMKKRASLVEHPFGTIKLYMGWTHFLMRGLEKVNAEMDLQMLSYNFKRVLNIIGVDVFQEYCRQRRQNNALPEVVSGAMASISSLMKRLKRKKRIKTQNLRFFVYQPKNLMNFCFCS